MKKFVISKRLQAVCRFVSRGARIIDVGTDHAFVPICLLKSGQVDKAWACDVNPGPLKIAENNALLHGLNEKIVFYLSDGLSSCDCYNNLYDHVVIAGMGGELIYDIIRRSDYICDKRPLLILQPMTMQPFLRNMLVSNGYSILFDDVVSEDKKFYTIIVCRYEDSISHLSDFEVSFGKGIAKKVTEKDPESMNYLKYEREVLNRVSEGKNLGGLNHDLEDRLISEISALLNEEFE